MYRIARCTSRFSSGPAILALLLIAACSNQRAPVTSEHPQGWQIAHASSADNNAPGACTPCHGADFRGGSVGISCFLCHAEGPPFHIHPVSWTDPVVAHRTFAEALSWTTCASPFCHGPDLRGGASGATATGPSCFSPSFSPLGGPSSSCHAEGPPAPHPRGFSAPELHGASARDSQAFCRNCHGRPSNHFDGGFVAAPASLNVPGGQCSASACHPAAGAHPTDWQGTNNSDPTFAASHRKIAKTAIQAGCALCHNTGGPGRGPAPGAPSCFSSTFTNANGSTTGCHPGGPVVPPHALPYRAPSLHGPQARTQLLFCQTCHGTPGTTRFDGGFGLTACSECHPDAGAHPANWQGQDDTTPDYLSTHRTVPSGQIATACALCHNTSAAGAGPVQGAPSCFSDSFAGPAGSSSGCHRNGPGTAPHAIPFAVPTLHGPEAKKGPDFCQQCHGTPGTVRFDGGAATTACSTCHPSAGAHPTNWQGSDDTTLTYVSSHRDVSFSTAQASCGICHNTAAAAAGPNPAAPSCFSTNHANADGSTTGCHPNGPGTLPHALPFTGGSVHGPEAKKDLTFCQSCHGTPATPAFDGGIVATVSCSAASCHPDAGAHPSRWQGDNGPTTHRSAGALGVACPLCHNTTKDAPGPKLGAPSCFSASFLNPNGSTSPCHPSGPGAPHARGAVWFAPSGHGVQAKADLAFCQNCHGTQGTDLFAGGIAGTACSAPGCHPDARAHPTNWQGTDDTTQDYVSTHRNAGSQATGCAICHDVTKGRTASDPKAPSCFSPSFTNSAGSFTNCHAAGPGAPHVLPFVKIAPTDAVPSSLHGSEAKKDLTFCEQCHANPFNGGPGSNPRFNVLLGRLSDPQRGLTGCEICHKQKTAHPVPWAVGVIADHKEFGNKQLACTMCHGANFKGPADVPPGVGPDCTNCHKKGLPFVLLSCTSCHTVPPNQPGTAADVTNWPNRQGAHGPIHDALPRMDCNACHNGAGTGTAVHFALAPLAPNDPGMGTILPAYNALPTRIGTRNADFTCSNIRCHGGQPTPNWFTGTIDRTTQCTSCHSQGPILFDNSPISGQHTRGNHVRNGCVSCHDPAKLEPASQRHYSGLDTSQFETDPATTVRTAVSFNGTSCNPSGGGLSGCHGTEVW